MNTWSFRSWPCAIPQ